MARKPGSKNKPKKDDTIHSHNLTTEKEVDVLGDICSKFELLGEEQRQRTAFFLLHKYPEYFTLTTK